MQLPIRKDSQSRCEAPSMLYDTVRNPTAAHTPPKPIGDLTAQSKDTIETTQQRLNREMMERFQNTSSRIPHQSFTVAAQAGKYLFMAIMLPTYICFYGIPRWFLMDALPWVFLTAKTEVQRVGKFFSELSKTIIDTMKGVLEQVIGDSLRMMGNHTKQFFQSLFKGVATGVNKIKQLVVSVHYLVVSLMRRAQSAKSDLGKRLNKLLPKLVQLMDKALNAAMTALNVVLYPLDALDRHLLKPFMKASLKKINTIENVVKQIVKDALHLFHKMFHPVGTLIKKMTRTLYGPTQNAMNYLQLQMSEWLRPRVETAKGIARRVNEGISKTVKKLVSRAEEVVSGSLESAKQGFQVPVNLAIQVAEWAWRLAAQPLKKQWMHLKKGDSNGKLAYKFIAGAFIVGGKSLVSQSRRIGVGLMRAVLLGFRLCLKWMKRSIRWLLIQLVTLPRKVARGVIWTVKGVIRAIGSIFYALRLLAAWIWALSRHSSSLLRELVQEIDSWLKPSR